MAKEKSSGYFWDVPSWRGSIAVRRMSFLERGVYREMLDEQWERRNLPDDPDLVADLIAETPAHRADILAAWPVVRRKFVTSRGDATLIYNAALERVRRKQQENRRRWQEAGRAGGKRAASNRQSRHELQASEATATLQPASMVAIAKTTDLTRQEETRPDLTRRDETRREGPPLSDARSKRPIFSGQRLTVFEWQLSECMSVLGADAEDFDLHGWFDALDRQAVGLNLVIPKRDGGEWLQAQLVAEAQRRGLPLHMATAAPTNKRISALLTGGQAFLNRVQG